MNKIIKFLLIVINFIGFNSILLAQKTTVNEFGIDSLYREDQFYAGVTYNLIGELPSGVSQSGCLGCFGHRRLLRGDSLGIPLGGSGRYRPFDSRAASVLLRERNRYRQCCRCQSSRRSRTFCVRCFIKLLRNSG